MKRLNNIVATAALALAPALTTACDFQPATAPVGFCEGTSCPPVEDTPSRFMHICVDEAFTFYVGGNAPGVDSVEVTNRSANTCQYIGFGGPLFGNMREIEITNAWGTEPGLTEFRNRYVGQRGVMEFWAKHRKADGSIIDGSLVDTWGIDEHGAVIPAENFINALEVHFFPGTQQAVNNRNTLAWAFRNGVLGVKAKVPGDSAISFNSADQTIKYDATQAKSCVYWWTSVPGAEGHSAGVDLDACTRELGFAHPTTWMARRTDPSNTLIANAYKMGSTSLDQYVVRSEVQKAMRAYKASQ
jgi:hypothetical protein